MGRGEELLLAPAGTALAKEFGGKLSKDDGLDGADCYLVNKTEDAGIAVLCVLAKDGSGTPLLGKSFKELPKRVGKAAKISVVVDPQTNLPAKHAYTRYSGWLVLSREDDIHAWLILTEPEEMTQSQVSALLANAGPKLRLAHDSTDPPARGPSI